MHTTPPGTKTPDDFRQVRRIFEAALERPPEERRAFLETACHGKTSLIAEVQGMLAVDAARKTIRDSNASAGGHPADGTQPRSMSCPSCKADVLAAHRFCPHCGTPTAAGGTFDEGRFRSGALFADRFRIVASLGRGGMGEVYRAHDLELGQPVALKFLSVARSDDRARTRLRTEVRLARQISHPNVCRVYDIGEAHGELYLSMEYVDGEDLAALLKRIGRLPVDKGIEITRKLCGGLAAAHAKGVLHRDFKPANIMVDGAGGVRIMDFGIAAIADRLDPADVRSGTPAYMAPEQLAGREATAQSDLYALGLVLYELFTGKVPFEGKTVQDLQRLRESHPSTTPSALIPELSPRVERIILRCLEPDPRQRPTSALEIAAALPGGNPLAEALAAGETPSPEMVAAAGDIGVMRPLTAILCLVTIALGIAAIAWMSPRTTVMGHVPVSLSSEVMADRARTIAAELGYRTPSGEAAYRYWFDPEILAYIEQRDSSPMRWDKLRSDRLTAVEFEWQSPPPPTPTITYPTRPRLPGAPPGTVQIRTDPAGRLTRLIALPERSFVANLPPPTWERVFQLAGLDITRFRPSSPADRVPPVFADQRATWEGVLPDRAATPVHVEAAARAGQPVYFELITPWSTREPSDLGTTPIGVSLIFAITIVVSAFVARRNIRLGRADRKGAIRTAAVMGIASYSASGLFSSDPSVLYNYVVIAVALTSAVIVWVWYVALEPYVRRVWPEVLIGWSRLLSGGVRDPLIGRDVLVAMVAGTGLAVAHHLWVLAPTIVGAPASLDLNALPPLQSIAAALLRGDSGFRLLGWLPDLVFSGVQDAMIDTVTLAFLAIVLRGRRRAAIAWLLLWVIAVPSGPHGDYAYRVMVFSVHFFLIVRFGLLALVLHTMPYYLLATIALRFDPTSPYIAVSYLSVGAVIALALYGFHTARGGRSIFADMLKEGQVASG